MRERRNLPALLILCGGIAGTMVVSIPMLNACLRVEPLVREQEVVSPIDIHKYEGARKVGEIQGKPATGHAVVELVGDWN